MSNRNAVRSGFMRNDVALRELVGRLRVEFLDRRERLLDLLRVGERLGLAGARVDLQQLAVLRLEEVIAVEPRAGGERRSGEPERDVDQRAGERIAVTRRGEDGLRVDGGRIEVPQRGGCGVGGVGQGGPSPVADERRDPVGRADALDEVQVAHLPHTAVGTAQQAPVVDDAGAEPLAGEQRDVAPRVAAVPLPVLGDRGEVRVVVGEGGPAVPVAQVQGDVRVHQLPERVVLRRRCGRPGRRGRARRPRRPARAEGLHPQSARAARIALLDEGEPASGGAVLRRDGQHRAGRASPRAGPRRSR